LDLLAQADAQAAEAAGGRDVLGVVLHGGHEVQHGLDPGRVEGRVRGVEHLEEVVDALLHAVVKGGGGLGELDVHDACFLILGHGRDGCEQSDAGGQEQKSGQEGGGRRKAPGITSVFFHAVL